MLCRNRWDQDQESVDGEFNELMECILERWSFAIRPNIASLVFFDEPFGDDVEYPAFWAVANDMVDRALFYGHKTSTATDEAAALLARVVHEKGMAIDYPLFRGSLENLAGEFAKVMLEADCG